MKVSEMPNEIWQLVNKYGLSIPKLCYMNCFMLVMQTMSKDEFEISYVLVNITDSKGIEHPHAVIKYQGEFFDPTLEPQNLLNQVSYSLVREFTALEIVDLMQNKFEMYQIKNMIYGKEPFWPLQEVAPNVFDFVDDGNPAINAPTKNHC